MGRKVELRKIDNVTRCQVTFSKRRSSLIRKAHEISVFCDVDIAFVAFSPSGRLSKFSSPERIEDVLERYVNLSADKRYAHIKDVEEKQEKLKELDHIIKGDSNKLHHLNKLVQHLARQVRTTTLELQMYEASLRDFELVPDQEPSLAQLLWCQRNLRDSFKRVTDCKNGLLGHSPCSLGHLSSQKQSGGAIQYNFDRKEATQDQPTTGQLLMQLDPWISPYSSRVRESIFQDLLGQGQQVSQDNVMPGTLDHYAKNLSMIRDFSTMHQMSPLALQSRTPQSYILEENNMNMQDGVTSSFQPNTNDEQPNWFTLANRNPNQNNKNVTAPTNFERISSAPLMYEPYFTPSIANVNRKNNKIDSCSATEKHSLPEEQVIQPEEYHKDLDLVESDVLWSGTNKEDASWECEDFILPDNLNLEDIDFLF